MKNLGKNRTIAVIIAALTLILSSAFSAFGFVSAANALTVAAAGETDVVVDVNDYYADKLGTVKKADDENGDLSTLFSEVYAPAKKAEGNELVLKEISAQLETIVKCADYRNKIDEEYPENEYAGDDLKKLKAEKTELLGKLKIDISDLAGDSSREESVIRMQAAYDRTVENLEGLRTAFAKTYDTAREKIIKDYSWLTLVTRTLIDEKGEDYYRNNYNYDSNIANEALNFYTVKNFDKVESIKDEFIDALESEYEKNFNWWKTTGYALSETEGNEEFGKRANEMLVSADTAEIQMKAVPHNGYEYAYYSLYGQYLDVFGTYEQAIIEERIAEDIIAAVESYKNFSDELKAHYRDMQTAMEGFVKGLDYNDYIVDLTNAVSTISDANGVVTVTAYFASDNSEAKVIPALCVLKVSNVRNGAAKRNASGDIKELDEELGVSYFIYVSVTNGNTADYKLPITSYRLNDDETLVKDYNGERKVFDVYYDVKINLEKYYEFTQSESVVKGNKSYALDADGAKITDYYGDYVVNSDGSWIKNTSYDEKQQDKLENIKSGYEKIKDNVDLSLCYLYKYGQDMTMLNASLDEGGTLMFTTSTLGMFCIAGVETENLLLNPLTWVAALALLIVIIIVIKIILKHARYRIKFVTNGGTPVKSVRAAKGEFFIMPSAPVKDGFVFGGWFSDQECTSRFIETRMRKRRGYKVYAKWVAPVNSERLAYYYDELKALMLSYEKAGYKANLGITEQTRVACVYGSANCVTLYLAAKPAVLRSEGYNVEAAKIKTYQDVPSRAVITTEEAFLSALGMLKRTMVENGMQPKKEYDFVTEKSTANERALGFELVIKNEKIASTAEDYFELMRIALKSYVLERDTGKFAPGDKLTLARIYINDAVACLYLPCVKEVKELSNGETEPRFADTPVLFKVLAPNDLTEAYGLIDKLMTSYGFVKNPENANDLSDTEVPATCGFAYTVSF